MIKRDLYRDITVDPAKPSGAPRHILGPEPAYTNEILSKHTKHLTICAHDRAFCSKGEYRHYWGDDERTNLKTVRLDFLKTDSDGKIQHLYHPKYFLPNWDDVHSFCPLLNKFKYDKLTIYGSSYIEPFTLNQRLPDNCHTLVSVLTPFGHERNLLPRREAATGSVARSNVKSLVVVAWNDKSSDAFAAYNSKGRLARCWCVELFQRIIEVIAFLHTSVTITLVGFERVDMKCFRSQQKAVPSPVQKRLEEDLTEAGEAHNASVIDNWANIDDPQARQFTPERYDNFKFITLKEYLDDCQAWKGVLSPEEVQSHLAQ